MGTKMPVIDIPVDEKKRKQIIKMFNEGKGISTIKREIFKASYTGSFGSLSRDYKIYYHSLTIKIYEILNIKDDKEYKDEFYKRRYKRRKDIPVHIKKAILKRDHYRCCITGEKENIHIHHIDGNPLNNSMDNLMVLSKKCHKAVHNTLIFGRAKYEYKNYDEVMNLKKKYLEYIKKHGYPNASFSYKEEYLKIELNQSH